MRLDPQAPPYGAEIRNWCSRSITARRICQGELGDGCTTRSPWRRPRVQN